jgi:hypothetical protein
MLESASLPMTHIVASERGTSRSVYESRAKIKEAET